ncbi:DUF805 domain-containing protein [Rhizobium tubonense]|uniref:DUF805 domain-containing protein n=1 Tax=Rhizobium tubonense TaxID=484088 RepID=A0A2W4D118_9HYPH|nr:hypothetical protein [Rhizobium tubonense]PZM17141.1 hypothetical protein CPY51_02610 [Rhizobium tubonense]
MTMLWFFFGFNMRLGRLHYFLSCIGLGVVMTAIIFAMVSFAFRNASPGTEPSISAFLIPALFLIPLVLWVTVSLQSMRIRDIGWNPAYVVPAWLLISGIDAYVAFKIPEWSIGKEHTQTVVGGLVNLFLTLALMFWPGKGYDDETPDFSEPRRLRSEPYTPPPAPPRAAAPAIRRDPSGKPRFGQRGL